MAEPHLVCGMQITLPFPQTRITYIEGWCSKKISKDIWWYYGICFSYIAIYQLFALSTSLIRGDVEYVGSRFARSEPET